MIASAVGKLIVCNCQKKYFTGLAITSVATMLAQSVFLVFFVSETFIST